MKRLLMLLLLTCSCAGSTFEWVTFGYNTVYGINLESEKALLKNDIYETLLKNPNKKFTLDEYWSYINTNKMLFDTTIEACVQILDEYIKESRDIVITRINMMQRKTRLDSIKLEELKRIFNERK